MMTASCHKIMLQSSPPANRILVDEHGACQIEFATTRRREAMHRTFRLGDGVFFS